MCKCLDKFNKRLAQEGLTLPVVAMLNMKTGKARETVYMLTDRLQRGSKGKRRKVIPTFCPFCGIKLKPAA